MKVYYFDPLPDIDLVPWLRKDATGAFPALLKGVPNPFTHTEATTSLHDADIAILPNNLKALTSDQQAIITRYTNEAQEAGKRLFLFSLGDFTDAYTFDPRAYVFRYSVYKSTMTRQDVVMLTMVEDYGGQGITYREKRDVPTVSFCGQGGYNNLRQWAGYYVKTAGHLLRGLIHSLHKARTIGVYWRRRMICACRSSRLVRTNFIIRHSFSAAERTIELDPAQARREFVDSIVESDFVLAPKGDGNYSNRFLETLSLGRIPVLPDTDVVLPFAKESLYESCVVRVPMSEVSRTPDIVRAWYDARTDASWKAAQEKARNIFETRLRFDAFFKHFFETVLGTLPLDAREHALSL